MAQLFLAIILERKNKKNCKKKATEKREKIKENKRKALQRQTH